MTSNQVNKPCDNTSVHNQHSWKGDLNVPAYWCEGVRAGEEIDALLASRVAIYGDRVSNMERVAALWSALLGPDRVIKDWEVPLLMSAYKMMRTMETPDYSDNSDDIDGWKKMFVEVMEKNHGGIVQARTVEEYNRKKSLLADGRVTLIPIDRNHPDYSQLEGKAMDAFARDAFARRNRADDDGVHAVETHCHECGQIQGYHEDSCSQSPF